MSAGLDKDTLDAGTASGTPEQQPRWLWRIAAEGVMMACGRDRDGGRLRPGEPMAASVLAPVRGGTESRPPRGPCRGSSTPPVPVARTSTSCSPRPSGSPPSGAPSKRGQYAVVHAARQSGKTTSLYAFAAELLAAGQVGIERVYHFGRGQPWITNALAALLVDVGVPERSVSIDVDHVDRAARELVARRDTHLDSLVARAAEDRVRRVLEPVVAGMPLERVSDDDRQYVVDLGLVRRSPEGGLEIANPIYENVLGRALASGPLDAMPPVSPTWLVDGRLVPERLLDAFLAFWRVNAEPLAKAASYPEIAPHLLMMAFLDRVANGGGSVDREFAAGTGRIDLLLRHRAVSMAFELKAWRDRRRDPPQRGLVQLDGYLDRKHVISPICA